MNNQRCRHTPRDRGRDRENEHSNRHTVIHIRTDGQADEHMGKERQREFDAND